ncbi:TRAP transporter TatT component family protein [Thermodesulfobacteriota bacterium]
MKQQTIISVLGTTFFTLALLLLSSCTAMLVNPILDPLTLSLQKQTDLDLLQEGAPSLLLILDGLIAKDPDNERLLMAAAKTYGAYATLLHEKGQIERAVKMSTKAKEYGISLLEQLPGLKNIHKIPLAEVNLLLDKISGADAGYLFWGAYGWAIWIQFQNGAPGAVAKLPVVEQIMLRVVALEETYYYGGAHVFLGTYYGSLPAVLGGKPEESRLHFERALALNGRKFLLTQVAYAENYARTKFDRELFAELLTEVIEYPLTDSETASSNTLAKVRAEKLLARIDNFF